MEPCSESARAFCSIRARESCSQYVSSSPQTCPNTAPEFPARFDFWIGVWLCVCMGVSPGLGLHAASGNTPRTLPRATRTCAALSSRSEEHTSELQSPDHLVCRLLLEKKKNDH